MDARIVTRAVFSAVLMYHDILCHISKRTIHHLDERSADTDRVFKLLRIPHSSRQQQLIHSSCHRDIEDPYFLLKFLIRLLRLDHTLKQRLSVPLFISVDIRHADRKVLVHDASTARASCPDASSHPCQYDDGELKPLALVDSHHAHDVLIFADDLSLAYREIVFLHRFYI